MVLCHEVLWGGVGHLIFGDYWYSWKVMSAIIIVAALIFVAWIIYEIFENGYHFKRLDIITILSFFALSPYAKYFLHEMGYYEQFGYVIVIFLFYFCRKYSLLRTYVVPVICGMIILLISESNAFLVLPIVFSFSAISIANHVDDMKTFLRRITALTLMYIPHAVYCLLTWLIKVPKDKVISLQRHDTALINGFSYYNFNIREDVYRYFYGDRSNADIWPVQWHFMHKWCWIFVVLLTVYAIYVLYTKKSRNLTRMVSVVCMIISGLAANAITLVAWDLARYYFTIFISMLFVVLFTLKHFVVFENKEDRKSDRIDMVLLFMMVCVSIGLSWKRFALFDGAVYNNSWSDAIKLVMQRFQK